ncbi:D-alanyl-D-alanine carboxypeptidase/D-alanyl-D-alanine endopeptidase [Acidithiobacillus sulfurivorans]|uniref:D-alanyl-D-alanine carboxypeptidase/D-alanyl-D-alanine-endopeptidase n=1 Tax=Acidithiobacillus sulfurivorans TaxID=1958756 RepID=A0ABS6A174_9PROT|nr:D-alanyl-D-alanine carboxypeptidase/D-alanyl-D-alanine-endopeptidase [Acidithiobacillus sulfurivorans]MBU2761257.1 D-alanyl-D-alanine carboxypeptidase/D-alanyl-D-alanine-endopeptidase [Acidithiobacillus sulfurivorans]
MLLNVSKKKISDWLINVISLCLLLGMLGLCGVSWAATNGTHESNANGEHWSIALRNIHDARLLLNQEATHSQLPASTAKLLTTAYILQVLGAEARQHTLVLGTVEPTGTVTGPLIVLGDGDPDISSRHFPFIEKTERGDPMLPMRSIAKSLYARGVRYVPDGIVVDAGKFPEDHHIPGWTADDQRFWYGAPVSALMFNDAMVSIDLLPARRAGRLATVKITPNPLNIIINKVETVDWQGEERAVQLIQSGNQYQLIGAICANAGGFSALLAQPNPPYLAALALQQAAEEEGIVVGPTISVDRHPSSDAWRARYPGATVLAERVSPSLAEEITVANKVSENTHVEVLLRDADLRRGGDGSRASAMQGLHDWLIQSGILNNESSQLVDGSGLSRLDRLSAKELVSALVYSYQQPWGKIWRDSLPVAAVDGTLRHRFRDLPKGSIRAKTGTLRNAVTLAGLLRNKSGEAYAFAIMVDHFRGSEAEARARVDQVVRDIILGKSQLSHSRDT